jgi:pimeloyl-ACP methyl ester carboxylesterase
MAAVHRDVTASGVRLRVSEEGAGPPVILLHGLFVDHSCWDGLIPLMRDEFRLIAPDLPGFGESEKPAASRFPYGVEAFAEAIADLYAGLALGRATLVGHALGGAVALTVAARHPELVQRLVLLDALCYDAPLNIQHRVALMPLIGSVIFRQLWGKPTFRSYVRDSMFSAPGRARHGRIDHYYETFNSPAARGSALATLRSTLDTRAVVARTTSIQTPTLVIWGRHDKIYPVRLGQRLAHEIRGAGLEVLDAGHAVHEERPADVAEIIARFLRAERTSLF